MKNKQKPSVSIVDSFFFPFGLGSVGLGGDRKGEEPQAFRWTADRGSGPTFYTDIRLAEAERNPDVTQIAWLIEPTWKPAHYKNALRLKDRFDYILSYLSGYFPPDKHLYYPVGGSWIAPDRWGLHNKSELVSIVGSEKTAAPGHRLRHTVIRLFSETANVDVYGRSYNPVDSKATALAPYCYSIVIESERTMGYFTEKLIDALSVGTVPIYWGDPLVTERFNPDGIITFNNLDELWFVLSTLSNADYESRMDAICENMERARHYQCAEDWLWKTYPFLFKEIR